MPEPVPNFIPPFAYARSELSFDGQWTLAGLLWVRLTKYLTPRDTGILPEPSIKFKTGSVGVVDVINSREGCAVILLHNEVVTVLYDDPNLFPSDTLIAKIAMLKDK